MPSVSYRSAFTAAGSCLANLAVAVLGTSLMEGELTGLYHAENASARYIKELLLSAVAAFLLGAVVRYKWRTATAKWIWVAGAFGLLFRIAYAFSQIATFQQQEVRGWAALTFVCVRTIFYSLGSAACEEVSRRAGRIRGPMT